VGAMTVNCYGINRPWDVGAATWVNATATTRWEREGCSGPSDRGGLVASALVETERVAYTWDVTELARRWVANPSSNHGLVLEANAAGSGYWTFAASDHPEVPPNGLHRLRPKLEIMVRPPAAANRPPQTRTITPNRGSAPAGTLVHFTATCSDPDGHTDLKACRLHIGRWDAPKSLIGNAVLLYQARTNKLLIRNDRGTRWWGGKRVGSADVIQNSQVKVYCRLTTVTRTANDVAVRWAVEFTPAFRGRTQMYLKARDLGGLTSPLQKKGTWTVQ
jgi:hypothetical protein